MNSIACKAEIQHEERENTEEEENMATICQRNTSKRNTSKQIMKHYAQREGQTYLLSSP